MSAKAENKFAYWNEEIEQARKREEKYRKSAGAVVDLYEGEKTTENSFNVLYSNTETLLPAIYNNPPRPSVRRRFNDDDPVGKAVSDVVRRGLEYAIDSPDDDYTPFDDLFEAAVIGALVTGRGVIRFAYDATIKREEKVSAGSTKEPEDQSDITDSNTTVAKPKGSVDYETVCGVSWPYDRVYYGFSRRWSDTPWIAYEHRMTREDLKRNFGNAVAMKLELEGGEDEEKPDKPKSDATKGAPKAATVYEIWQKSTKKVIFFAPDYKEDVIKEVDDPLGIPGFYDQPEPLHFTNRNHNMVPVVPYKLYEQQAIELNRITMRINKVMHAIKVRGFYPGSMGQLGDLMQKPENTLLPAEGMTQLLMDGKNLDNFIWTMPLEKLVAVLQQLYQNREQIKQTIYEITGISDILRGASVASETATAQNIKNQWGTMRLKRMQKLTQVYIRSCLRLVANVMASQFELETWIRMTKLSFPRPEEKQQAQAMLQAAQQMAPMMQGQPPSPEIQQQLAKAQEIVAQTDWGQIMAIIQSEEMRGFNIDIETNSTVDPDATEDKQNITDLFTALAQVMQALGPGLEQGYIQPPVVKEILLTVFRRYQFGVDIEDAIKKIPDQMPQQGDPKAQQEIQKLNEQLNQEKMNAQKVKMDADMKAKQTDQEMKLREDKIKHEAEMREQSMTQEFQQMLTEHMMEVQTTLSGAQASSQVAGAKNEAASMRAGLQGKKAAGVQPNPQVDQTVAALRQEMQQFMQGVMQMLDSRKAISGQKRPPMVVVRGEGGRLALQR